VVVAGVACGECPFDGVSGEALLDVFVLGDVFVVVKVDEVVLPDSPECD